MNDQRNSKDGRQPDDLQKVQLPPFKMKWWGWGSPSIRYNLEKHSGLMSLLKNKLGINHIKKSPSFNIEEIGLASSKLPSNILADFKKRLGESIVSTSRTDRVYHSFGKSYRDLIRIRSKQIDNPPDLVLFPHNENHIKEIFKLCEQYEIAIIPFGGGTSVVGGVEIQKNGHKYSAVLNTTAMKSILEIDRISHTCTVQAGIFGPALEEQLNQRGFTLGHFPQSFEYSTLGGWIASRASGQNSILYGGIERIIVSVDLVTPTGEIRTLDCPRRADGPDFRELILGSEGTIGIITGATIRIHPMPDEKLYFMLAFKDFREAMVASRVLMQRGLKLAMIRTSDEVETEVMQYFGKQKGSSIEKITTSLVKKYFSARGFEFPNVSFLLIGLEGTAEENAYYKKEILRTLTNFNFLDIGTAPGKNWLRERFFLPYLRDELLDNNIMVDAFETATSWSNLDNLHQRVREALEEICPHSIIMAHLSHLYCDGASLYFSIMTKQTPGKEYEQWEQIKTAVNQAIIENNGVITHHHGIGTDHKNFLNWTEQQRSLLHEIKKHVDPKGILNPGKIL